MTDDNSKDTQIKAIAAAVVGNAMEWPRTSGTNLWAMKKNGQRKGNDGQ